MKKSRRGTVFVSMCFMIVGLLSYISTLYEKHTIQTINVRVDRYLERKGTEINSSKEIPKITFKIFPDKQIIFTQKRGSCLKRKKVRWKMLTFIKSPISNVKRRQLIRRTWGKVKFVEGAQFSILFVTGTATKTKAQEDIERENKKYKDILQANINDDYRSLVYKTLAGMQWANENLPDDYLYSTADDDFIVNVGDVQEIVDKSFQEMYDSDWPEFPIICMHGIRIKNLPKRVSMNKNYISKEDYKWPMWPTFCLGGMYTTSSTIIKSLYKLSLSDHPIATDDIWITGILRHKLGMPTNMVIKPEIYPAMHYGYLDEATFDGMKYWKNISKNLKAKDVCMLNAEHHALLSG